MAVIRKLTSEQLKAVEFTLLFTNAVQNDWLRNDKFWRYFSLKFTTLYESTSQIDQSDDKENHFMSDKINNSNHSLPLLELSIIVKGNPAFTLFFPPKVTELYHKLFYHCFLLIRANYVIHRKRFYNKMFCSTCRMEYITLQHMIHFVNRYHKYIFESTIEDTYNSFKEEILKAKGIDDIVQAQYSGFLCKIFEHSKLDSDKAEFTNPMIEIVTLFISYAKDDISFDQLNNEAPPLIVKIKRILFGRAYVNIRHALFGSNFTEIGPNAELEPIWKSLRREL